VVSRRILRWFFGAGIKPNPLLGISLSAANDMACSCRRKRPTQQNHSIPVTREPGWTGGRRTLNQFRQVSIHLFPCFFLFFFFFFGARFRKTIAPLGWYLYSCGLAQSFREFSFNCSLKNLLRCYRSQLTAGKTLAEWLWLHSVLLVHRRRARLV